MSQAEKTFTIHVGTDGRITVPKGVREALALKNSDLVECTIKKVKPAKP